MHYLSLRNKLIFVALLVLVGLSSYFAYFGNDQMNKLFDSLRSDSFDRHHREMTALLNQSSRQLLQLSDFISQLGGQKTHSLEATIDSNWESLQMNWGVESAALYSSSGGIIKQWGNQSFYQESSPLGVATSLKPNSQIVCRDYCIQSSTAPLLSKDGALFILQLNVSLADILRVFTEVADADVVILGDGFIHDKPSAFSLWDKQVIALTRSEQQWPRLRTLAQQTELRQLIEHNTFFFYQDKSYEAGIIHIEQERATPAYFLIINDFSGQKTLIDQSLLSSLSKSAVAIVLSILLLLYLAWRPIARLKLHADLIPMFTLGKFGDVRDRLSVSRGRHCLQDEIDILDKVEIKVSRQLEDMENKIKEDTQTLQRMAMYSDLTGLPNRNFLHQEITSAIESGDKRQPFTLIQMDVDSFKNINELYGHTFGDELIKAVATRLHQSFNETDFIAHIAGSSFSILVKTLSENTSQEDLACKTLTVFESRFHIESLSLGITVSAGLVSWPKDASTANELIHRVELAMYKAKELGKNRYEIYSQDLEKAIIDKLSLEEELKRALKNQEFILYYQPQVALSSNQIIAAEALVRWQHPEKGLISPIHFIPILEETGLISQLDDWVLKQTCMYLNQLQQEGLDSVSIAVNLSAQKYSDPQLVDQVYTLLQKHNVPAKCLELEMTESMAMQDIDASITSINLLRELGVSLSIDDFGTGHSSLSYLTALNIDILKIDCSFIHNIPDNEDDVTVTSAIIALAQQLKLKVIAEGVETEDQRLFLKEKKCDFGQGYLFSRPIPPEEFKLLIKQERQTN